MKTSKMTGLEIAHEIQKLRKIEAQTGLDEKQKLRLKRLVRAAIDRYESGH